MPVEAKPLFRPEVIPPHIVGFGLPPNVTATMSKWAKMLATGLADEFKEKELLPNFLSDVFFGVLGYSRAVEKETDGRSLAKGMSRLTGSSPMPSWVTSGPT